ncbi:MAG: 2-dehydropantoate 2-reductase [Actinomycetota bacterium]|nr:2-dehydropantoate 2-reductase [Actinomycetota bacterium]
MSPRVCIVGAGAVGSLIGARLAAGGVRTSALARGSTLDALRSYGWRLSQEGRQSVAPVRASDNPVELGAHDVVLIAVKTPALPDLAPRLAPLIGPDTVIVPAMNGVPWWFCAGLGGPVDGVRLRSVDATGGLAAALDPSRVVGCVVHLSASMSAPGQCVRGGGNRLILGEPSGTSSGRLSGLVDLLAGAGFDVSASARIQTDVWFKLWGNLTMNPISVLTGTTMDHILDDDLVQDFVVSVMGEARAIGERIGCPIEQDPLDRIAVTRAVGAVRTSMLQDADAGRAIELDALVGAAVELGSFVGVATPWTNALLGLTRVAARARGLYPPG